MPKNCLIIAHLFPTLCNFLCENIPMNGILRRLKNLGYDQGGANYLYAMHMSRGTLDLLICYIENLEAENKCKE